MIRVLTAFVVTAFALVTVSCCCSGEPKAKKLSKLPKFKQIETAPAPMEDPVVIPSK